MAVDMRFGIVRFDNEEEPHYEVKQIYRYPDGYLHYSETGELYGCKLENLRNVAEMIYNDTRESATIFAWDGMKLTEVEDDHMGSELR